MRLLNPFVKEFDQATSIALLLQKLLRFSVSKTSIIDTISNHPDNPSFYALSQGLNKFGIECEAFSISDANMRKVPVPFVAHLKESKRDSLFILVTEINSDQITYLHVNGRSKQMSVKSFFDVWTRNALLIKSFDKAFDKNYKSNIKKERSALFLTPIISFIFLVIIGLKTLSLTEGQLHYLLLVATFLIGLFICFLILSVEISGKFSVAAKLCNGSAKMNCNNVITSERAKLFGVVSWGEIGFVYFFSGLLGLIFIQDFSSIRSLYNILTVGAIGFVPYSIYAQRMVLKSWCTLCLFVLSLIAVQFLVTILCNPISFSGLLPDLRLISYASWLTIGSSFLFSVLVIYIVKPKFISFDKFNNAMREVAHFKFNPKTFEKILTSQQKVALPVDDVGLFIGNKTAHTRIIIVTNPYCKPCSNAHLALERLLEKNSSISVHVIFSASNRSTDKRQFPAKCFLWIRDHVGGSQSNLQLEEWYKSEAKDYSKLVTDFAIRNIDQYNSEIEVMNQWCEKSQVTETPTVFINGFRLSSTYSIEDLNYFINHLDNMFSGKEHGTSLNPSQFN